MKNPVRLSIVKERELASKPATIVRVSLKAAIAGIDVTAAVKRVNNIAV